MGVASELDPCCERVVSPLVAEMLPEEGAGVGGGDVPADDGQSQQPVQGGVQEQRVFWGVSKAATL